VDALTDEVSDVGGTLSMDITARGPVQNPNSSGFLTLNDGKFKIVPLNVPVRNVTSAAQVEIKGATDIEHH
jgi:autotransporter translocation and assembly factor TamB